jgi:hypothetical protein
MKFRDILDLVLLAAVWGASLNCGAGVRAAGGHATASCDCRDIPDADIPG